MPNSRPAAPLFRIDSSRFQSEYQAFVTVSLTPILISWFWFLPSKMGHTASALNVHPQWVLRFAYNQWESPRARENMS